VFIWLHAQVERRTFGNLVLENIPEVPTALSERLLQYQNTRSAAAADWTPDGESLLITTRFGETAQFHLVRRPGGAREQITFSNEPVAGGEFCPAAREDGFLFARDAGGDEFFQIYYFDRKSGKIRLMTDGTSRNTGARWSRLGDRFIYASTRRNKQDLDLYIRRLDERYPESMVLEASGSWSAIDWSPDDRRVTVSRYVSVNESYLYMLDLSTGDTIPIRESEQTASYSGGLWSADGEGIFFTSDQGSEFKSLRYFALESKTFVSLSAKIPWDIEDFKLSPDGNVLAFTANENGVSHLYLLETRTFQHRQVTSIPKGIVSGLEWNKDSKRLALTLETATSPADAYVLNTINYALEQWTYSEVGGLDRRQFVEPTLIQYPTFDTDGDVQRQIPAYFFKPKNGIGPFPVLISIHGGPEGQYIPNFNPIFQYYLSELGLAIVAPNVRGSSGYGKTYLQLDNGFKREDSVKDIGALLDWISRQPELDASRVAVIGGSYGGYMSLACMIHYIDRLRCGIDMVGISNFVTFLNNTQAYRRDLRRMEYGDERDPRMRQFLESISPTNNAHKITKPMLIGQGLNDPRVPASESAQMVDIMRRNGGTVWYLLANDEGHGFRKKSNRDFYAATVVQFFQRHLLSD
jgi:dipeptidyl aminopeptidase/acylaminoacyl peptidase